MTGGVAIAIVGAGLAGLACAERLGAAGYAVRLFDKGRGPGGRMSTRRIETPAGEVAFDHGASFFTAADPAFRQCVEGWKRDGLAAAWPEAGPGAVVGLPSMNAPLKAMAAAQDVRWSARVKRLVPGPAGWMLEIGEEDVLEGPFAGVIVAIPPEQATPLLADHSFDLTVYSAIARSTPVWTAMVAFEAPLPTSAAWLEGCEVLERAVCETAKPGRARIEAWTLQATRAWSEQRLGAAPALAADRMLAAFARRFEAPLPATLVLQGHLWRFARPAKPAVGANWHANAGLGLCGDWVQGDGVEAAWRSGVALADRVIGLSASAFERPDLRPTVH